VNPEQKARVCIVAITRHGAAQAAQLARDLPEAHICTAAKFAQAFDGLPNPVRAYEGALRDEMAPLFAGYDQLVFFVSLGAVVRLIAPVLKSKDEDPGVTVVDDAGQFVIPVLSGHVGGANAMSERIADLLGATPVLTTASDVGKTIPVDILGRHLGWQVQAPRSTSPACQPMWSTASPLPWCKRQAAPTGGPGPRRCLPMWNASPPLRRCGPTTTRPCCG
jgi:cobalt-precorrin 5A hydrolase